MFASALLTGRKGMNDQKKGREISVLPAISEPVRLDDLFSENARIGSTWSFKDCESVAGFAFGLKGGFGTFFSFHSGLLKIDSIYIIGRNKPVLKSQFSNKIKPARKEDSGGL